MPVSNRKRMEKNTRSNAVLEIFRCLYFPGEKVTNLNDIPEEGMVTLVTDKGTETEGDLIIKCVGSFKINSDAYKSSLGGLTLHLFNYIITVYLVFFACLNFREFLTSGLFTKFRIHFSLVALLSVIRIIIFTRFLNSRTCPLRDN